MDLKQIQELIRFVAKAGVSEVQLEQDDFKIVIKTGKDVPMMPMQGTASMAPQVYYTGATQPSQPAAQSQAPAAESTAPKAAETPAESASKTETIKSPMIGTFYRRPSPDKEPYVKVGDTISKGQVVCVVEAMKLFNEIESDISGRVVKILLDDSSPVEYDQPLFLVEPA